MSTSEGGYQLWARKTLESDVFQNKPAEWFKLWFFLVMTVQWSKDKKLPRGSIFMQYKWIKDKTNVNRNSIDHFLRWARANQMLATAKATRGVVISLLNYAKYQDPNFYKSDSKSDTIYKEDNKDRKKDILIKLHCDAERVAKDKELGHQINTIIDLYREINPALNFGNRSQRDAAAGLIKKFGYEEAKRINEVAISIRGQPYAPEIASPYDCWKKLPYLESFFKKNNNSQKRLITNFPM